MEPAQFQDECQRLARPRFNLRRVQGAGDVVGVWGGSGFLPRPVGNWEHRITVSCDWLGQNGFPLSGFLGVYECLDEVPFRARFVAVQADPGGIALSANGGIALVGVEDTALPPVEALELYGSEVMRRLLQDPGQEGLLLDTYEERCPLFYAENEGIYAMLGGWHTPWPENDGYDDEAGRLVLWTFKDAEPWLEVWQRPGDRLEVVPRIT